MIFQGIGAALFENLQFFEVWPATYLKYELNWAIGYKIEKGPYFYPEIQKNVDACLKQAWV